MSDVRKVYRDGKPIIPRVYRWARNRWRGYLGTVEEGVSYGLCPSTHRTQWAATRCAQKLAKGQTA